MDYLFYHCFILFYCWTHSDGIHSLQMIHWWTTDVMLNFSKSVSMRKQTLEWAEDQQIFNLSELFLQGNQLLIFVQFKPTAYWFLSTISNLQTISCKDQNSPFWFSLWKCISLSYLAPNKHFKELFWWKRFSVLCYLTFIDLTRSKWKLLKPYFFFKSVLTTDVF